jgi:hypothetical protein
MSDFDALVRKSMKRWKFPDQYLLEIRDGLRENHASSVRKTFANGMVVSFAEGLIDNVVHPPSSSEKEGETPKKRYYVVEISPNNMYCRVGEKDIESGEELCQCSSLGAPQDQSKVPLTRSDPL